MEKLLWFGILIVFMLLCCWYKVSEYERHKRNKTGPYSPAIFMREIRELLLAGVPNSDHAASDTSFDNSWRIRSDGTGVERVRTSVKPILWIYIPSQSLQYPYLHLTTKSIIRHCRESFTIVMVDDSSFTVLLDDAATTKRIKRACHPVQEKLITLCMIQLLQTYGGMVVPMSFLCFRDLKPLYDKGVSSSQGVFACETPFETRCVEALSTNVAASNNTNYDGDLCHDQSCNTYDGAVVRNTFQCSTAFMGVKDPDNDLLRDLEETALQILSTDFTEESLFLGTLNQWVNNHVAHVSAYDVGTRLQPTSNALLLNSCDRQDIVPLSVELLLSSAPHIDFSSSAYGVWMPHQDILKRRAFDWFLSLDVKTLMTSSVHSVAIAKYFVFALS